MADGRPGGGANMNGGSASEGFFLPEKGTREELKIAVNVAIERFRHDAEQKEFTLPSSLTAAERKYIHQYCHKFGFKTQSHGQGSQRSLTVYKKEKSESTSKSEVKLSGKSFDSIDLLLKKFPVTNKEKQELSQKRVFKGSGHDNNKAITKESKSILGSNAPVPPRTRDSDVSASRAKLPIHSFRDKLLKSVKTNQVTLVTGDTGCGKTTQVGQYILEDANRRQQPCRIVCTQPRRISAISVAERVAYERGEQIGQTVGYQIRLESKVSPKTALLYCTNGVLLRLLMAGHKALANITHVIMDEIHERDKFSDYLLICLRDQLKSYKNLRVVLMSAALNIDLFRDYFGNCPIIHIPVMCHKVEEYFLEDVLEMTGYSNKAMRTLIRESEVKKPNKPPEKLKAGHVKVLKKGEKEEVDMVKPAEANKEPSQGKDNKEDRRSSTDSGSVADMPDADSIPTSSLQDLSINEGENQWLDPEVRQEMDKCLNSAWVDGDEDAFDQILHLIMNENVNVDHRHRETTMTTLMVASARGFVNLVEHLLELGADPDLKDVKQNWSASDWARNFNQGQILRIFNHYNEVHHEEAEEAVPESEEASEASKRLEMYHNTFDDDKVDHNLIMALISHICKSKQDGAILVFLPGYDDIVGIKDRLLEDKEFSKQNKYTIFMLHSMMQPANQRKVFRRPPTGMRKIILSTNIAETSVTIEDVVFVIDSGKVKEKSYDALSSVSCLRSIWISKASALQRRGRAGRCRPGNCYHLMSRYRFHSLALYQDAEILRAPIHELCLQTKLLAAVNVSIADFLGKAAEPPPFMMIRNSVSLLKSIDALDDEEELTELGKILVDLPIDPRLGKMILFGIMLKCLDPVLTIATSLAYKDPFVLPTRSEDKRHAYSAKVKFSGLSFSDHFALAKAYKQWSKAREEGNDRSFCSKNFVSSAAMEMISGMRNQLVSHLRNLGLIRQRGGGDMKDLNSNSQNWSVIKAAVLTGVYPAMLQVDRESGKIVSDLEKNVRIHPSSILSTSNVNGKSISSVNASIVSKLPYDWLYFDEMTRMHVAVQVRCLSAVPAVAVALLAGPSLSLDEDTFLRSSDLRVEGKGKAEESDSDNEDGTTAEPKNDKATLKIDEWISFHGDDDVVELLMSLRIKFLSSFVRRISSDGRAWSQSDDAVVQCLVNVLSEEENTGSMSDSDSNRRSKKTVDYDRNERSMAWGSGYRGSPRGRGGRNQYQRNRDYDNQRPRQSPRDRRNGEHDNRWNDENGRQGSDEHKIVDAKDSNNFTPKADRYFIVKCNNYKNLEIAMSRGIWATTKSNERKLDRAYRDGGNVYLIFSIQGSGNFQGYAKMVSEVTEKICSDFGSVNLGGIFSIQWISKGDIPFQFTQELTNPWNENKKVQISRDGQELEPSVGAALCSLWDQGGQPLAMQQQQLAAGAEYPVDAMAGMQTAQLDPAQAFAVVEGQSQAQVYITNEQQAAALYGAPYAPADVHEIQAPYHHPQAMYAPPHMAGFAPQQMMPTRYPPAEMYQVHPQAFMQYRRQGGYAHYYPPGYQ